ncbi:isoaspartyl peptidase/L-asparaginase family protein [Woodsholea maritima]|uniref:isoaspartyl peptidase/L-asparaginase family protein n=1 Tax=Woodsholea maritima TaxID=240237 RepID=UPI000362ECAE|nr:isoaspartyl peptidase/L-asparaginase [Woodsholea maritima]
MAETRPTALVLHGGASVVADKSYEAELTHLREVAEKGKSLLAEGMSALDVCVEVVKDLEEAGLYVAGKGSSPNQVGRYELDAALMEGHTRKAGSVASLVGYRHPIAVAQRMMITIPHVMLVGEGAAAFAKEQGMEEITDPESYYTPAAVPDGREIAVGTVGCVALDQAGHLAAATSTGGTINKRWGRVGDSPLIGAGTWADSRIAVSCTGQGEYFIRAVAAADVAARVAYGGASLDVAVIGALGDVKRLGGDGGMIAVARDGSVVARFTSQGMKRAIVHPSGKIEVGVA